MNQSSGNILKTFVESVAEQGLANESPGPESLAPQAPEDNAAARKKSSEAWAAWWKDNSAKTLHGT